MGVHYKKIGILDHMGYGNLGDAATQEALIASIKRRMPNTVFTAFSLNPDDTRKRHNILSYPINWNCLESHDPATSPARGINLKSKLKSVLKRYPHFYSSAWRILNVIRKIERKIAHLVRSYRVLRSLDLMIISGGGQLCELWGGPWSHPCNVFKFSVLAKLANRKLFILNVGAGPLERRLSKFFARWSVRLANYTSLRDVESQALLRNLGVKNKMHVYPDIAYALDLKDYVTEKSSNKSMAKVGLNPIGFCDPRFWPRKDYSVYRHYLDKLAFFSSWLLAQNYNLTIFTGEISVDRYVLEDLRKLLLSDFSADKMATVFQPPKLSLRELLLQMSKFDIVITSKFHGVIFSHLLTKPVIALSYHNKIDNLMQTVGHHEYCLNIEDFDVNSLKETFSSLVQNGHDLKPLFRKTVATYGHALEVEFDKLFGRVAID